jgi:hypothetical protein
VNIREKGHIIVIGPVEEMARLDASFPRPLSSGYEPAFPELLDASDELNVVRIGAHMFRENKKLGGLAEKDLRRLDALEVNGKDFGTEEELLERARRLDLPVVAGSDAHHWLQIGRPAHRLRGGAARSAQLPLRGPAGAHLVRLVSPHAGPGPDGEVLEDPQEAAVRRRAAPTADRCRRLGLTAGFHVGNAAEKAGGDRWCRRVPWMSTPG